MELLDQTVMEQTLVDGILNKNTMKIMLGLSLVHMDVNLFHQMVKQLGETNIQPFSSNFRQCKDDYDPQARKLLELVLKACLISGSDRNADQVFAFAKNHNYLLTVDE